MTRERLRTPTAVARRRLIVCPAHGCGRAIRPGYRACTRCWYRLPKTIRYAVADAGQISPTAVTDALAAAAHWWIHHPLPKREVTAR